MYEVKIFTSSDFLSQFKISEALQNSSYHTVISLFKKIFKIHINLNLKYAY